MTLRELLDWIWWGEGLWVLNGFIQAWNLLDNPSERYPELVPPKQDDGEPWHGGPAYPLGIFEDEDVEDLLADLR